LRSSLNTWAASTYTVLLQNARNSCFRRAGGLLGRRCGFPQIEHPILIQLAELQHLGIVAPELISQSVGQADALDLELFVDAGPLPELDYERLGDAQLTVQWHVLRLSAST